MKKVYARPLTLKNIHATAWKNSYKEFDNEKKFLRLENSLLSPPLTLIGLISMQDQWKPLMFEGGIVFLKLKGFFFKPSPALKTFALLLVL